MFAETDGSLDVRHPTTELIERHPLFRSRVMIRIRSLSVELAKRPMREQAIAERLGMVASSWTTTFLEGSFATDVAEVRRCRSAGSVPAAGGGHRR
ncbi:MAG: hypothetical protein R2705_21295 [Ilumatobacteraceae bacterium]